MSRHRLAMLVTLLVTAVLSGFWLAPAAGPYAGRVAADAAPAGQPASGTANQAIPTAAARVVAVGVTGAAAISPVGRFLPGGPIHDTAAFAALTQPGRVLEPNRLLVGSSSNFGAPLADPSQAPGSLLSIDPSGDSPLVVPPSFATADGQVSTLDGRVQIFSAQSPAFRNGLNTPAAVTAGMAGVSNPQGLSINNGFGRIWPANVPAGLSGPSTESILDPTGLPLASAPDPVAGGVFAADLTNRQPQQLQTGALMTGAVGTALLGRSPDKSTRAVFAIVLADGSVVQAHTQQGVDGLAPAGTVTSLLQSAGDGLRIGTVLNFEPLRILYMTDPIANTVVALTLLDDGRLFQAGDIRRIASSSFNTPVGLAPAMPETEDIDWASNTTLAEFSDLYVANRADDTIVRISQGGAVIAERQVTLADGQPLGDAQLSAIAVSPDGSQIWVTVTGVLPGFPGAEGAVLALPAFGAP